MKTANFNIEFAQLIIKGNKISFPFSIVMQTKDNAIEKHCIKTWPQLMHDDYILTPNDKGEKMKMVSYIKKTLLNQSNDMDLIHKFFYDRRWMNPIPFNKKITSITLNKFECKLWSNPEIPYLELKGWITIDLEKLLDGYLRANFITIKQNNKFIRESILIKFTRSLPLLLTYIESVQIKNLILQYFITNTNKQNTFFIKKIEKLTKLTKLHTFRKKIFKWKNNTEIILEINDLIKLLKKKALRPVPLTAAGFITANMYKQYRKNK